MIEKVSPLVVQPNRALKMQATRQTMDCYGNERKAGEEWLIRETGAYLPLVHEKLVSEVKGIVLTEKTAVHLRAL